MQDSSTCGENGGDGVCGGGDGGCGGGGGGDGVPFGVQPGGLAGSSLLGGSHHRPTQHPAITNLLCHQLAPLSGLGLNRGPGLTG